MNRFVKGMLVGIGIGLLVAPMRGEEMRRKIGERLQQCRGYLPEQEQMDLYKRQITDRVSQTTDSLKGYAQQAASTVKTSAKSTASNLSEIAQNAASNIRQTGKDVAGTTRETVNSAKTDTNV
ncbi:MAG TPA: YtxH domain-containing protein [Ktedonobacteraceae bacterium]|nr:YtxH domain-containing protein [Ktedonobacteraceae bacterium]